MSGGLGKSVRSAVRMFGLDGRDLFTVQSLPYAKAALAPHISEETLNYHHGKHYSGYVAKLAEMRGADTVLAQKSFEDIVKSGTGPAFNMAGQIYNHAFYFQCLMAETDRAKAMAEGGDKYADLLKHRADFLAKGLAHFGSGWVWLVWNKATKSINVMDTHDAGLPLTSPDVLPLLVCDLWEHAYYIDRRNDRKAYLAAFWDSLSNIPFAHKLYEQAKSS